MTATQLSKILVKPNSVPDPGVASRQAGDTRFVFVAARLIEIKGIRTLLDAWARADTHGLRLVIAGDGELRALVEERAATDSSIEYLGWLDEDSVTRRMRDAEVVLVPSQWYEGLPLVILRSLSVGTPLLVSDLENFAEDVVGDGVGWSFKTGDAADLGRHLSQLARHPERSLALRPRARDSYEARYSPAVDLVRLEEIYRQVSSSEASPRA